ncbi:MAG: hypothetical protein ACPG52_02175 [Cognaticolwellia sp.]
MRTTVKYRLIFLLIAFTSYYLGFVFIPESTSGALGLYPVIIASIIYFLVLPILHWFLIIKAGQQKAWKILIILSISSAVARYSFPEDIAQYFEFILWLRYPIMAVLLIIELYLMYVIVKGLWQARNLTGDPRIGAIEKYDDEKKQGLALTFATEPASWYYAIPRLSRKHIKALDNISLLSGKAWHYFLVIVSLVALATLSYQLLVDWSETAAIIAATFILYSFILLTANYRLSRHYSIYVQDDKLIINNSIFNFMVIPLADINAITLNSLEDNEKENSASSAKNHAISNELLKIGRGKQHNIKITFTQPIKYWGMMGAFVESFEQVLIEIEQPTQVITALEKINSAQPQLA